MVGREFIKKLCEVTIGYYNMNELSRQTGVRRTIIGCINNSQQKCKFKPEDAIIIVRRYPNVNQMWLFDPDNNDIEVEYQEIEGGISNFARIEALCQHYGLSVPQLEKELGMSENVLYNIKYGKVKHISPATFHTIIDHYPELNPTWLAKGTGEMFLDSGDDTNGDASPIVPSSPNTPDTPYIIGATTASEEAYALAASLHEERIKLEATLADARSLINEIKNLLGQMHDGISQVNNLRDVANRLNSATSAFGSSFVAEDLQKD